MILDACQAWGWEPSRFYRLPPAEQAMILGHSLASRPRQPRARVDDLGDNVRVESDAAASFWLGD